MQVLLARIIVCFWKQFYGVCGLGHHGAICLLISAIGTACSDGFADGLRATYLSEFSRKSVGIQISNTQ